MKIKKILIILMLFCSGCTKVNYTVDFGSTILETIIVDKEKIDYQEYIEKYGPDAEFAIPSELGTYLYGYNYDIRANSDVEDIAAKRFLNIEEFIDKSIVFNKLFDKSVIKMDGSKVKINIKLSDYTDVKEKLNDIDAEITLKLPYYVIKHNASSVNGDKYNWKTKNKDKITIEFDMTSKKIKKDSSLLYLILGISVIILVVSIFWAIKHKKNNKL